MATNYDKFIIHPAYADGHNWDEFIEALERAGLEKSGHPKICWSQILHPRSTLFRSKDEGPFDIVTVELTWIGDETDGPFKKDPITSNRIVQLAVAAWWAATNVITACGTADDSCPPIAHVVIAIATASFRCTVFSPVQCAGRSSSRSAARLGSAPPRAG